MVLAEWVWGSFRPGKEITADQRIKEVASPPASSFFPPAPLGLEVMNVVYIPQSSLICPYASSAQSNTRCADKAVVVHVSVTPLVLSLLLAAGEEANVGLVLDSVLQLSAAVEPLRSAAESAAVR